MDKPRLRGKRRRREEIYPLGQIPNNILLEMGKQVVHRLATGLGDISGDNFGTIFAQAIGGTHLASPLGLADVICNRCAWSVKTVQSSRPFEQSSVRLISGRNSPDYSMGITDVRADLATTGAAVLSIWNARVGEAMSEYNDLRIAVLIRNISKREFVLFEEEAQRFIPQEYKWTLNDRNNLEGLEEGTGAHRFTWQPHGAQFTIIRDVPASARSFSIVPTVPQVSPEAILSQVQFNEDWIRIHR